MFHLKLLLDAKACIFPIFVTDISVNIVWIQDGHNRFVIPRKDSVILAEKIIGLLKNKELRHKFGENNLRIAKERGDINENFKTLESMYKKLVIMNDD